MDNRHQAEIDSLSNPFGSATLSRENIERTIAAAEAGNLKPLIEDLDALKATLTSSTALHYEASTRYRSYIAAVQARVTNPEAQQILSDRLNKPGAPLMPFKPSVPKPSHPPVPPPAASSEATTASPTTEGWIGAINEHEHKGQRDAKAAVSALKGGDDSTLTAVVTYYAETIANEDTWAEFNAFIAKAEQLTADNPALRAVIDEKKNEITSERERTIRHEQGTHRAPPKPTRCSRIVSAIRGETDKIKRALGRPTQVTRSSSSVDTGGLIKPDGNYTKGNQRAPAEENVKLLDLRSYGERAAQASASQGGSDTTASSDSGSENEPSSPSMGG